MAAYHNIEVEDTAVALLEYPCGALGVIEGSTCAYPGFERRLEIHGSCGCVIMKNGTIEKLVVNGKDISPETACEANNCYASGPRVTDYTNHAEEYRNFIAALCGEEELLIDAYEGKKAVELIEKIYTLSEKDN